jgi:hypothetical protein
MSRLYAISSSRPRLVWLLWCLVLLVPLMQAATTWHGLSHAHMQGASSDDGKPALHKLQCDFCLTAASLIDGAAAAGTPALPQLVAFYKLPQAVLRSATLPQTARAYESRAPPLPRL